MKANRFLSLAVMALMMGSVSVLAQNPQQPERGGQPAGRPAMQQHPGGPQGGEQKGEKEELTKEQKMEMQAKRMCRELLLDEATAEKFTAVYTEYLTAVAELRGEKPEKPEVKEGEKPEVKELTDAEILAKLKERTAKMCEMATLQEKYIDKFAKVLNARQIEKIFAHPQGHGPRPQGFGGQRGGHGPQGGQPHQQGGHGGQQGPQGPGQGQPGPQGGQPAPQGEQPAPAAGQEA